ncbi:rho GTPase-activating protein 25 isoform X2 [Zootoca vivipara]|uniref:rho GTPase-activating protein 25 isoform X2 n=1 Tax=Zootoca vivipara TaxID=8524 RepID=UPI001590C309|nr:rho GTPase-activating protein 25 isoform X2 [Zootoca vivipara]
MSLKLPRNWDFNLKMDMSKIVRSQSMMAVDPKGSGSWSHPPNLLERPLKTGWLKKQRSIVKNWQQRYFVLKGQHLYYYKDEEDLKPQGSMRLHGSTIREVAATGSDEVGKFIFEIVQGISGDQNRAGQDSYVLMASSQSDMEDWVKSLRRMVGSPLGVFGQQLVETMVYEQKFGQHQVPILVEKCAEFIRKHGLNEEGIFRLPGQDNLVKELRDAFDAGERPSFDQDTDVHTVASLLKLYLRELPEPAIPWTQYEDFLLCGQLMTADQAKGHQQLVKQLSLLPRDNYNLLSYICRFLHEVQQSSATNKMSVENLATVFGVNLIRPKIEDPATIMRGTPQIQKVMSTMISDHAKLLPISKDIAPASPLQNSDSNKSPIPRSSVGWDAAQRPLMARAGNRTLLRQIKDNPDVSISESAARSAQSAEGNGEMQPSDVLGTWTEEPRKRTQTLPSRKCFSFLSSNRGNQSTDGNEIFNSEFWSSPSPSPAGLQPVSSTAAHKRTLSGGLSKWFSLPQASNSHTLSGSALETRKEAHDERPLDQISEISGQGSPIHDIPHPGQNGAVVANPSPESRSCHSEDPEVLRKMIAELKEEMESQKKDYEEQIRSLEKENYEVWAKVVKLNKEIEKEKNRFAELESKLQGVERSQADVEKKNKLLENSIKSMIQSATKSD